MIIAHANRESGGWSVSSNLLRSFDNFSDEFAFFAILPVGYGYEELVKNKKINVYWFKQRNLMQRFYFDTFKLPRITQKYSPDITIALGHLGYPYIRGIQFVRFADPHFVYPKKHFGKLSINEKTRYFFQAKQLQWTLKHCRIVYCQTATMLERLKRFYSPRAEIKILPNSLPIDSANGDSDIVPEKILSYQDRFKLFYLARYNPHKNIERIVDAFAKHRTKLSDVVVFLTINKNQNRRVSKLLNNIQKQELGDYIVNIGPIRQMDIGRYFSNCDCLLFPSLLESFSATYLEAMHFGLPIITSDLDFARDVCGDAAFYCNPWSSDSIIESILRLKNEKEIRKDLIKRGQRRLAIFHQKTWYENANEILSDAKRVVNVMK